MKRLTYGSVVILGLILLAGFVAMNLSVQQIIDFEALGLQVENTDDARVRSGSLRVRSKDLAGLGILELSWDWCPSAVILNWCTELQSETLRAQGQLGYKLSGALNIARLHFELDSLSVLGIVPGILDTQLRGQVASMQIQDFSCPLRNAAKLQAQLILHNPKILGNPLEDINAEIEQTGTNYSVELSGDQVQGELVLNSNLSYQAKGEITPPANLAGLMDSMAIPLGNGRYAWQLEGDIPC